MKIFCLLMLSVLSLEAMYIPNVDEVCEAGRNRTQINYEAPVSEQGGYVGNVFFQEDLSKYIPGEPYTLRDTIFQLRDYDLNSSSGRVDFIFSLSFNRLDLDSEMPAQTELHATYFFLSQGEAADRRRVKESIIEWLEHSSHNLSPGIILR